MHPYVTAILTFFHKYQVRTGVVFISIVPLQVLQHMPFPAPSLSQLRGHIAGLSCPLCHRNFFNGEKRSAVPSLVDSRRSLACFETKNQYVPGTAVVQIKKKIPGDQRISGDECIFFFVFFCFFFFHPIYLVLCIIVFALLFSFPPINSRNSDPESHSRLFSPLPSTVRALHFYREKVSALSSLVDSRRIVLTHAIIGAISS